MRQFRVIEGPSKIVVRGADRLAEVWPSEALLSVGTARRAELGHVEAVLDLLASVAGEDTDAYRLRHRHEAAEVQALTAHTRAAVLRSALQLDGPVTPATVLAEVHSGLRRPIDPLLELLAS